MAVGAATKVATTVAAVIVAVAGITDTGEMKCWSGGVPNKKCPSNTEHPTSNSQIRNSKVEFEQQNNEGRKVKKSLNSVSSSAFVCFGASSCC